MVAVATDEVLEVALGRPPLHGRAAHAERAETRGFVTKALPELAGEIDGVDTGKGDELVFGAEEGRRKVANLRRD